MQNGYNRGQGYPDYNQNQYQGGAPEAAYGQDPWAAERAMYQQEIAGAMPYMSKVYAWMFMGLVYTAAVAGAIFYVPAVQEIAFTPAVMYGAVGLQLVIVFFLHGRMRSMSAGGATAVYFIYSTIMAVIVSVYLKVYMEVNPTAVPMALAATGGMFGVMTIVGMTTKKDLSGIGALCGMAFIGIIIASVANMFVGSSGLSYIISIVAVVALVGFTAYDTQMAKREAQALGNSVGAAHAKPMAIFRAMSIYMNVVLLFLYLLRIFGGRN